MQKTAFISNLKIRAKLLSSFLTILLITITIGINGLRTANDLRNNFDNFYTNNFLGNMILSKIQLNQQKSTTEMQRILYKTKAMNDKSVFNTSVEALNEITKENDLLIQQYEANYLLPEEKELWENIKATNSSYRSTREEVIEAVRNGQFSLAVELNEKKARFLREEVTSMLERLKKMNEQIATDSMNANKRKFILSRNMSIALLLVGFLAVLGFTIVLTRMIARSLQSLAECASSMSEGDFTCEVPEKLRRRKDEIGMLANAFSEMNNKIRAMLKEVCHSVAETSASSQELSSTVEEVTAQQESVTNSVHQIATGMEEISTSIEKVATASSEIRNRVQKMKEEAIDGEAKVEKIKERAEKMKDSARLSKQTAGDIYRVKQQEIKMAIEKVKVVGEIIKMVNVISKIAEQTNLLALNAAIEAAHAGEHGQGFAVVAEEVRKLAEHSASTARDIQQVVQQVNDAVEKLTTSAKEILEFIDEKVTPDYNILADTAEQYAEDSNFVKSLTNEFAAIASQIATSIEEIGKAIEEVAATVEEATASSEEISNNSLESNKALEEVAKTAQMQAEMAERLNTMVARFKV
ncbi:MAG: methyl-accepting chemotaxis protein [Clostridiaceae bacterium]|nr:methyl-accepting chemotaxis protein [Clostridiaceae bacterium]